MVHGQLLHNVLNASLLDMSLYYKLEATHAHADGSVSERPVDMSLYYKLEATHAHADVSVSERPMQVPTWSIIPARLRTSTVDPPMTMPPSMYTCRSRARILPVLSKPMSYSRSILALPPFILLSWALLTDMRTCTAPTVCQAFADFSERCTFALLLSKLSSMITKTILHKRCRQLDTDS